MRVVSTLGYYNSSDTFLTPTFIRVIDAPHEWLDFVITHYLKAIPRVQPILLVQITRDRGKPYEPRSCFWRGLRLEHAMSPEQIDEMVGAMWLEALEHFK